MKPILPNEELSHDEEVAAVLVALEMLAVPAPTPGQHDVTPAWRFSGRTARLDRGRA